MKPRIPRTIRPALGLLVAAFASSPAWAGDPGVHGRLTRAFAAHYGAQFHGAPGQAATDHRRVPIRAGCLPVSSGRSPHGAALAHLGAGLTEALRPHLRVERGLLNLRIPTPVGELTAAGEFSHAFALGLNCELDDDMRLKAEFHNTRTYDTGFERPDPRCDDPVRTRCFILSASARF